MQEKPARTPLAGLTALYLGGLRLALAALPAGLVAYLHFFQTPPLVFRDYAFHEVAIGLSIALSAFAAWVSYRCYRASGEPALRYVTLAFLGFALVYAPHGILTRHADHNMWFFILFGPASRVVMAAFLLEALLRHGEPADPPRRRAGLAVWAPWVAAVLAVDFAVAAIAHSPAAGDPNVRLLMESLSILLCLFGLVVIVRRRLRSGLMVLFAVALVAFATSSFAFLLTKAWTHLWWLAHAIFAGGFFALSYGMARSYLTTRSIVHVYNEEEMVARLAASEASAAAAHAAEARLMALFETSPIGIVMAEPQGQVLYCNRRQAEMLGIDPVTAQGGDERQFYDDPSIRDASSGEALATGRPVSAELACRRSDGSRQWSMVTWTPMEFEGRRVLVAWNVDVADRRRAAKAMEQAKHAAESANRAKTEFLACMSHELRTPLNAINGFAETMQAEILGPLGNERYREYCGHIVEAGHHLTELINDVLDVSRVETGRVALSEGEVDIRRLVDSALVMVGDRAREGEVRLAVELADRLPSLRGDELRLKQALLNLLANAVKFTPPGGSVTVRAWRDERGALRLAVSDTGIGIHPEDRDKALAPFGQVDSRIERRYEGMGLGLPLARNLVELHGGSLELDGAPGEGTTVTLRFPPGRTISNAAE